MIRIVQYKWAGKWGPFKIISDCKECDIIQSMLKDMKHKEFRDKPVLVQFKPWLDNWIYCLARGAFHPPIIMVDGKNFFSLPIRNLSLIVKHWYLT
jgi:hypothetical protein